MRGWVKVLLVMTLLPMVIGGVVLLLAGRPLAFEILHRRTASKFPDIKWISTQDLDRWRADSGRPQPVILDARTAPEFELSHLKGAIPIDPYKPSLRSLQGLPRDTALVIYSSAGYRGARVASWLSKAGYPKGLNLAGGIFQWTNEGRLLFRGGEPPNRHGASLRPKMGPAGGETVPGSGPGRHGAIGGTLSGRPPVILAPILLTFCDKLTTWYPRSMSTLNLVLCGTQKSKAFRSFRP